MYINECVHFLFILNYRRCIIERTVTSLLFHVPTFTLCLLVVRSTSPCRQDHERTNVCVCVCVCVKSPEEEWLVRPKYRETSSCFSLCCFVIYVYTFVALSGFGFVKVYMDLPLRINKPKQKEGILHCYGLEITCNNSHNSTRPSK